MKKIIAVHDLSGIGTASLGTVIPILSVMGSYVCPLQTAALSTITGVFENFTFTDLTLHIKETIKHWKQLNMEFDYIYSGFLGSPNQVGTIIDAKKMFGCKLMVDPVFGDDGQLYPTMNNKMVESMKELVSNADIITPNITEAMFLLGEKEFPADFVTIKEWLVRLCDAGPDTAIITSCNIDGEMYVCCYCKKADEFYKIKCCYHDGSFHGTGDIFASVMLGAMARGQEIKEAVSLAVDFVSKAIEETKKLNSDPRLGVAVQKVIKELL
ncbi:MAG: pyridoxamine kinase [Clostridia bacterium]|nr:pyridoxamine kinase [Clostridia bacterium]